MRTSASTITAYDALFGRLVDESGVDIVLAIVRTGDHENPTGAIERHLCIHDSAGWAQAHRRA